MTLSLHSKILFPLFGCLLALLGATPARAQLYHDVRLDPAIAEALPVYVQQVLDLRPNQNSLGWVNNGLENIRLLAHFRTGLAPEVAAFLHKHPRRLAQARPVIMVVRRVSISEQVATLRERAYAEWVADFYYQHTDGYHLLCHTAELTSEEDLDATHLHPRTLTRGLVQALSHLRGLDWNQLLAATPPLSWAQLQQGAQPALYPILSATTPKAGIYSSLSDFRSNNPSNTAWRARPKAGFGGTLIMELEEKTDSVSSRWRTARGNWGFSDGKEVYVNHLNDYYRLTRQDDGQYTYQAPVYVDPRQQTLGIVYTPGGAMIRQPARLTLATLYLQLDTGFAGEKTPTYLRSDTPAATATITVFRRPDAVPEKAVQILLEGRVLGELLPAQYLQIQLPAQALVEVSVCGLTEREACFRFRPDTQVPNFLDCRLSAASQPAPTLRLVSAETGAAAIETYTAVAAQK